MSKARGCFVRCGTGLEEQMRGRVMSFYTWEIGLALSVIPTFRLTPAISRLPARNWARRNG